MKYIKADKIDNRAASLRKGFAEDAQTRYLASDKGGGWLKVSIENLQYFSAEIQKSAVDELPLTPQEEQ